MVWGIDLSRPQIELEPLDDGFVDSTEPDDVMDGLQNLVSASGDRSAFYQFIFPDHARDAVSRGHFAVFTGRNFRGRRFQIASFGMPF